MNRWLKASVLFLGLILITIVLTQVYPPYEEQFIAMGVLGNSKTANNYFSNNSSNIPKGTLTQWYLYLNNHMSSPKNVSIRVKLLNSTLIGPDNVNGISSPVTSFYNINLVLASNQTQLVPFSFTITKVTTVKNAVIITMVQANDMSFPVNIAATNGQSFRIVFELWSYDVASKTYVYSWVPNQGFKPVWNQIWFNVI